MFAEALPLLLQVNHVDLSGNHLSGTLPSSLAGLAQVSHVASNFLESSYDAKLLNSYWCPSCLVNFDTILPVILASMWLEQYLDEGVTRVMK